MGQLPTRDKRLNTDMKLKRGMEVRCCEKVTYTDGDAFVRVHTPLKGWVPILRQNGELKMMAEREIPPETIPPEAVLAANPGVKKPAGGLGASLKKGFNFVGRGAKKTPKASATE